MHYNINYYDEKIDNLYSDFENQNRILLDYKKIEIWPIEKIFFRRYPPVKNVLDI